MFTRQDLIQIIRDVTKIRSSEIYEADALTPFTKQSFTLDLSNAVSADNPRPIGFAFKSFILKNASGNADNTANIFIKFNKNDSGISWVNYLNNDSETCIDGMWSDAFLYWDAQPGKSIQLVVSTNSDLRTGSLILGGSVVIRPSQNSSVNSISSSSTTPSTTFTVPSGTIFRGQISCFGGVGAGSCVPFGARLTANAGQYSVNGQLSNWGSGTQNTGFTVQCELPAGEYTLDTQGVSLTTAGRVAVTGSYYDVE